MMAVQKKNFSFHQPHIYWFGLSRVYIARTKPNSHDEVTHCDYALCEIRGKPM